MTTDFRFKGWCSCCCSDNLKQIGEDGTTRIYQCPDCNGTIYVIGETVVDIVPGN